MTNISDFSVVSMQSKNSSLLTLGTEVSSAHEEAVESHITADTSTNEQLRSHDRQDFLEAVLLDFSLGAVLHRTMIACS